MSSLTTIDGALPAHLAAAFSPEANTDLVQGVSQGFPILSYKGKNWHVVEGDSRMLVADDQGEPLSSVELIILKANPHIGKTYYPEGYEEGSSERPICYSNDSVAPAPDAEKPQAKKCAVCPWNQFGSKITDNGARGKACSDFRRLAVAPSGDIERPMMLRVPAASLKELVSFGSELTKRGVPYQALVTKIGFDTSVAYPKLTFRMVRWLDEQEVEQVREMMDSDIVNTITALNAPVQEEADVPDEMGAAPAHVQNLAPAPAAEAPAPAAEAPKAAAKRATKATATPAEVVAAVEPDAPAPRTASGFGGSAKAAPKAAEPEATTTTVLSAGALGELDRVLADIDDQPA